MKKTTLLIFMILFSALSFAQTLNESGNWPNTNWTLTGAYDSTYLYSDPTTSSNFSFDDDNAGSGSNNDVAAESPVTDLTAAYTAGETWIYFTAPYVYQQYTGSSLTVEYWDADAAAWVSWIAPFNTSTTGAPFSDYCTGTFENLDSEALNIASFTTTQLTGFKYRVYYDDGDAYAYGFCLSSPTITSATPPTCPDPSDLVVNFVGADSAIIGWTENGSATKWNLDYGVSPYTQGTNTAVAYTTNPATVNALTPNTTYELYVQADCGGGDTSAWIGPITFTTACAAQVAPYTEGFENGGSIPSCWEQGDANGEDWVFATSGGHIGNGGTISGATVTGNYFAYVDDSATHNTGTTLLTPFVDVSALTTPALSFYMISDNEGYTNVDFSVDFYDGATWNTAIYTSNTNKTSWTKIYLDLSGYTISGAVQVRFIIDENNGSDFYDDVAIDDVSFDELPPCLDPTDLVATSISDTEATVSVTQTGTYSGFTLEYGPAGFTLGTGTQVTVTSFPYTITNLTEQTDYEFYVQTDCGGGDTSNWSAVAGTFTTICSPIVAPYTEPFSSSIPTCWAQGDANGENWIFSTTGGHVGNAGTLSGNTASDNYFAYVDDSATHNTGTTLLTPLVDVSALTTPALSFYMISDNEGYTNVDFSVDLYDGATWNTAIYTSNTNKTSWTKIYLDLSGYTISGAVQVRFIIDENNGSDFYDDLAIDDVSFDELPTCIEPFDVMVDSYSDTTATISLLQTGTAAGYNVEYGTPGFTQGTGTSIAVTGNPFSITSLAQDTDYEFYVQADCGGGDTSIWVGPYSFTTLCSAVAAPYYTDFENSGSLPTCWRQGDSNSEDWVFSTSASYVDAGSPSEGYFAYVDDSSPNNTATTLYSPLFDVSTLTTPSLYFYLFSDNDTDANVDFSVDVFDGTTWTDDVYTLSTDVTGWQYTLVDLSSYVTAGVVQVRFVVDENNGTVITNDFAIDDVYIDELPTCPPVMSLAAANATGYDVELSWTQLGTESAWYVEYGPVGFTQGTGTVVPAGSNPFTLNSLSPATDYEYYVYADCTATSETSFITGPGTFTTECVVYGTPYHEDFENAGTIPNCWTQGASNSEDWNFATGSTGYVGDNGTITGNTLSNNYYAWFDASSTSSDTQLISPQVDISGLATPSLSFYIISNAQGGDNVDFSVDLFDGTSWITDIYTSNSDTNGWELVSIDLSTYTITGPVQARFVVDDPYSTFLDDIAVDDVMFDELPTCDVPSDLAVDDTSISTFAASFTWTENGTAEVWTLEYGPTGFTPGTGTMVTVYDNVNGALIEDFLDGTTYDVYVYADCFSSTSLSYGPVTFTTLCLPKVAPYSNGFEAGGDIPPCWSQGDANGEDWVFATSGGHVGSAGTLSGSTITNNYFAYVDDSSTHNVGTTLYTPFVDVSALTNPVLYFYMISDNEGNTNVDFSVDFFDGTTWHDDVFVSNTDKTNWTKITIALSGYTITGPVQARFVVDENNGADFYDDVAIDDVTFDEGTTTPPTTCPANVMATVDPSCGNEATTITWDAVTDADGYYISMGTTAGGTDILDMVDMYNSTTYNFVGLVGTTYYYTITPYNAAGASTGCTEYMFTTSTTGCYCDSNPTSNDGNGITNITLGANSYTVPDVTYHDLTASTVTQFATGADASTFVTFETGYTYDMHIWIDFDDNYIFENDEIVFTGESSNAYPTTYDATYSMPTLTDGAVLGLHRMRLGSADTGQSTANPCYSGSYGVTVDFTVDIVALTCSPLVATTNLVVDCASSTYTIDIDVTDLGDGTPTITDGVNTYPVTTTGIITAGPYAFGTNVTLNAIHGSNSTCNFNLGAFGYDMCPPANDDLCNAIPLTVVDASTSGNVTGTDYTTEASTSQTDEPLPSCFNSGLNGSVWFSFIAPSSGEVQVTTDYTGGSSQDTEIAVYAANGVTCSDLSTLGSTLGCDQDGGTNQTWNSIINFDGSTNALLTGGEMYYIQVDSYADDSQGSFSIEVIDLNPTATENFNNVSFSYYPNPVNNNQLTVSSQDIISNVNVTNMLGQTIMRLAPNTTNYVVNMSQLASGTYFVEVFIGDASKTVKIIKE
ncbi:hypothetical protein NBRC110019_31800 [Neptunitalea chrysea]|uniref:T9SS type A sorting domain-containing protein n=1 Tax=Neptunitalea chrysea TaxID=1647581 RepID=A0A9W6EVR3_9FLAO|nr:fibronectin type III domain-containing protein [Neptunitalea chrysea]GLB54139.1 hypothetical protein NBRC110019_31800 [Neptunitalea chrysea]